jgi:hypothetical protein
MSPPFPSTTSEGPRELERAAGNTRPRPALDPRTGPKPGQRARGPLAISLSVSSSARLMSPAACASSDGAPGRTAWLRPPPRVHSRRDPASSSPRSRRSGEACLHVHHMTSFTIRPRRRRCRSDCVIISFHEQVGDEAEEEDDDP